MCTRVNTVDSWVFSMNNNNKYDFKPANKSLTLSCPSMVNCKTLKL